MKIEDAKALILSIGLNPTSNASSVASNSGQPLNLVTSQSPTYGEMRPLGSSVVVEYNYIASNRFQWAVKDITKLRDFRVLVPVK